MKYIKISVPDDFDTNNNKILFFDGDKDVHCSTWEPIYRQVLDYGHVGLIDFMGSDDTVVNAARVSYGQGTKRVSEDRGLIRYLIRNRHWTPIEMPEAMYHIKAPIFVFRQWHRHRMASINEYSARYSVMKDEFYMPDAHSLKPQSSSNKQGKGGFMSEDNAYACQLQISQIYKQAAQAYHYLLGETDVPDETLNNRKLTAMEFAMEKIKYLGTIKPEWAPENVTEEMINERVAISCKAQGITLTDDEFKENDGLTRELSRIVLPVGTYSEMYWKSDLRNTMNFLSLRCDPHAQEEIKAYADIMLDMLKPLFPICMEAFIDYQLEGATLSRMELETLRKIYELMNNNIGALEGSNDQFIEHEMKTSGASKREIEDFMHKIKG